MRRVQPAGMTLSRYWREHFAEPLGLDVVTEQTAVPLAITLRTRVEDQGNTESGIYTQHVSGIDTNLSAAAVVLYVV